MKSHILLTLQNLDSENNLNFQNRWEYLKYEIRKFSSQYSKNLAKIQNIERQKLENQIKELETNVSDKNSNIEYIACKDKLDAIYEKKANGLKIRSKCDWYEHGEKSTKFFLNLEKNRAVQSQIRNIIVEGNHLNDQFAINKQLYLFYKTLFKNSQVLDNDKLQNCLSNVVIPRLSTNEAHKCKGEITEKEIFDALNSMENNKSPGNDGITKEFYVHFWDILKQPLLNSIQFSYLNEELGTSQRQAVIKLIERKIEIKD